MEVGRALSHLVSRLSVLGAVAATQLLISGCERAPLQPSDTQVRANLNTLRAWPGSPLPAGAARFRAVDASLVPEFADPDEAVTTRAALPAKANGQTHIEDRQTGLGVDISLVGANATTAQVVDGYVVYPRGHALGWVYQRAEPSGLEDYLVLDARPASPSIAYQVKLGPSVAGLRLVENQLELLDASGAPRLRLAPPYVVGNDGVRTDALLAVEGCAVNTDPAGPWGRAVTRSGPNSCRIIVSWANDGVSYPALLDPRWQTTGSLSVARQDHNLITLPLTGKVLAVGGRSSPTSTTGLASAELFDNNTRTWSATSSMTGGRWSASATLLGASANGTTSQKVLIAGGINGTASVNTAQLYDQTAGTWGAAGTLNAPRHLHTATLLNDGRVLVCGGMNGTTILTSAALYNPASGSGSWAATTGPIPPPGWRSGTATLIKTSNNQLNNKVLLAGGNNGTSTISSVFLFDPAQSAFSTLASMPSPREGHTAVALSDGRILFAGGKNGSTTLASAVIFDPSWGPGSWNATGSMTTPRWGHAMNLLPSGVLNQGLVLVSGGSNGTSTLSTAEYWNGVKNGGNWATDGVMVAPVQQHASVALGNSLLVAGGAINNGSTTVSAAEVYDPSIGLGCTLGSQCASGLCVAGVCCDSACDGKCGSCNLPGHLGTCTPVETGSVCRPATGLCDAAETCDGASLACPADAVKSSNTICRESSGSCDVAETCTGTSATCPADGFQPDGTSCNDGDACTIGEKCATGVCKGGTPLECKGPQNCDPILCDSVKGCLSPTGCIGAGDPETALYVQTWETGIGDWKDSEGAEAVTETDPTSPAGATVQKIDNATKRYQTDTWMDIQPGDYCVAAYVRWVSGSWPFIGVELRNASDSSETAWAIGQSSYPSSRFSPLAPVSATQTGWQYVSRTIHLDGSFSQARLVDELWNGATKGGPDLAYFDGLAFESGVCATGKTVYETLWEGPESWSGGPTVGYDPTSPAGPGVQVVQGTGTGPFASGATNVESGGKTYCVRASVRWVSGQEPYVGIQFSNSTTPDFVVGGDSQFALSSGTGWQTFGANIRVPEGADSAKLVTGLSASNGKEREGANLSYFDGLSITTGPCQRRPPISPEILPSSVIPNSTPPQTPGSTAGALAVTDNGVARYRIPLWVPPGRRGIQPSLALTYTSDARDSIMGKGWAVEGFSRISRCPKDYTRDGKPEAVQFDNTDPVCLDGERLVLVSGERNRTGSEYRTEENRYWKILQVGEDSLGPTGYLVFLPDGTRLSYGFAQGEVAGFNGSSSAVLQTKRILTGANDNSSSWLTLPDEGRLAWALASLRDRYDNEIVYAYSTDEAYHAFYQNKEIPAVEFRPTQISYTKGTGEIAPTLAVTFAYDEPPTGARQDIRDSFINGFPLRIGHLLTSVTMSVIGPHPATLRIYRLGYANNPTTALLKTVQECDGQGTCKPESTFSYTENTTSFTSHFTELRQDLNQGGTSGGAGYKSAAWFGDFNGDGLDDIVTEQDWPVSPGGRDGLVVRYAKRNTDGSFGGFEPTAKWLHSPRILPGATAKPPIRIADLNGDGIADLVVPTSFSVAVDSSCNKPKLLQGFCPVYCGGPTDTGCSAGTADGYLPIDQPILPTSPGVLYTAECPAVSCSYGNQNSLPSPDGLIGLDAFPSPLVGDFDGDGRPDLIRPYGFDPRQDERGEEIWSYLPSVGRSFGANGYIQIVKEFGPPMTFAHAKFLDRTYVADINGDGKSALLFWDPDVPKIPEDADDPFYQTLRALARPNGGYVQTTLRANQYCNYWQFADVNGDGLPDATVGYVVQINTGRGFTPGSSSFDSSTGPCSDFWTGAKRGSDMGVRMIDFDGDGRSDSLRLWWYKEAPHPVYWQRQPFAGVMIAKAGVGGFQSITPLTVSNSAGGNGYIPAGYSGQVADVNGDGLADLVQEENLDGRMGIVVYVRDGQKSGLLNSVKDGFGNTTTVEYRPLSDPSVHEPVHRVPGACPTYQSCEIPKRWVVAAHTVNANSANALRFDHQYEGARNDIQGLGYLGMDAHTIVNRGNGATVKRSYDHVNKRGALFYPGKNKPSSVWEFYPTDASKPDAAIVQQTSNSCELVLRNTVEIRGVEAAQLVDLSSCSSEQTQSEMVNGTLQSIRHFKDASIYESDQGFGYLTHRYTSAGMGPLDYLDPANETTHLSRTGFVDDAEQWMIGRAGQETLQWHVPKREDSGTPAATGARNRKYTYESGKGVVHTMTVEPSDSDNNVYQKRLYEYTAFGQLSKTTIETKGQERSRYTAVDFDAPGDVFPVAVRVGGYSSVQGEVTGEKITKVLYDQGRGLLMQATDPNGLSQTRQYDTFGRIIIEQRTDGAITGQEYIADAPGRAMRVLHSERDRSTLTTFDDVGRTNTVQELDDQGNWFVAWRGEYDEQGRISKAFRPYPSETSAKFYSTYLYDSLDRLIEEQSPIGKTTWKHEGLRTKQTTDASTTAGNFVQVDGWIEDQSGRVIVHEELVGKMPTRPGGEVGKEHSVYTTYVYGPFDTLSDVYVGLAQGSGNHIHLDYDVRGRRTLLVDPDVGTQSTVYNTFGNVTQTSELGTNKTQKFTYDALGRKIAEDNSETGHEPTIFQWDLAPNGIGKLATSTSRPDGVVASYEYDPNGRLTAEVLGIDESSYRVDYGYDEAGRLGTIIYPVANGDRYSVKYGFDSAGFLKNVREKGSDRELWSTSARNLDRRVATEQFGDKSTCQHAYFEKTGWRWASTCMTNGGNQTVALSYAHDQRGYLTERKGYIFGGGENGNSGLSETFTHDELGRLTHWTGGFGQAGEDWGVHYEYDDFGNLKEKTVVDGAGHQDGYSYISGPSDERWGGPHAVTTVTRHSDDGGSWEDYLTFNYDGAGRQVSASGGFGTREIEFTDYDLPRRITGSTNYEFAYDASRRRAKKSDSNGNSTTYLGKLYEKREGSGVTEHVMYVLGEGGGVLAQVSRAEGGASSMVDYITYDHVGSVAHVASSDGSQTNERFDPFGGRITAESPVTSSSNPLPRVRLGFTGVEADDELGLINMHGRIYDPGIGRFISADGMISRPDVAQGYNRYSYAYNSPVRWTDPSGFQGCDYVGLFIFQPCGGGGGNDEPGGNGGNGGGGGFVDGNGSQEGNGGGRRQPQGDGGSSSPPPKPKTPNPPFLTREEPRGSSFGGVCLTPEDDWAAPLVWIPATVGNASGEGMSAKNFPYHGPGISPVGRETWEGAARLQAQQIPNGVLLPVASPPWASMADNMALGARHAGDLIWLVQQVDINQPMDYKSGNNFIYEEFGNMNYGALGTAMGIPEQVLLRAAGVVQIRAGTSDPSFGRPLDAHGPFADSPIDQFWIHQGVLLAQMQGFKF